MNLPRPVATPTREAHLSTLRSWHESRFGARIGSAVAPPAACPAADDRPGEIIVATSDALLAVDPVTGEVRNG